MGYALTPQGRISPIILFELQYHCVVDASFDEDKFEQWRAKLRIGIADMSMLSHTIKLYTEAICADQLPKSASQCQRSLRSVWSATTLWRSLKLRPLVISSGRFAACSTSYLSSELSGSNSIDQRPIPMKETLQLGRFPI